MSYRLHLHILDAVLQPLNAKHAVLCCVLCQSTRTRQQVVDWTGLSVACVRGADTEYDEHGEL